MITILRMLLSEIVGSAIFIGVCWILIFSMKKGLFGNVEEEILKKVKKIINWLTFFIVVLIVIHGIYLVTYNVTPRSTLDDTNKRQGLENFEKKINDDANKPLDTTRIIKH